MKVPAGYAPDPLGHEQPLTFLVRAASLSFTRFLEMAPHIAVERHVCGTRLKGESNAEI
jgi:hypothetical protein